MPETDVTDEHELHSVDPRAGKYVVFRLAQAELGVAVHKVQEVIEMLDITAVPNAQTCVAGVINLRGKVVPVVDLRGWFGLPRGKTTLRTGILALRVLLASREQVLGMIVDEVVEVLNVSSEDLLEDDHLRGTTEIEMHERLPCLFGVALVDGRLKFLLDVDEVLNHLDLGHSVELQRTA